MRDCKVWSVDTVSADMEQRDSQVYLHDTAACSFTTAIYSKERMNLFHAQQTYSLISTLLFV